MRRRKGGVSLGVEVMESRALLTGVVPVLTMNAYNTVIAQVRNVMGTLAKTHDFNAAGSALKTISAEVPYGQQQLDPTWQGDLGIYSAQVPGSGLTMQNQILKDLNGYLVDGEAAGTLRVTGTGSAAFSQAAQAGGVGSPAVSAASVNIVNKTGLNLTVTTFLSGTTQKITRQIANNAKALFDFQSSSMNFINVSISRSDGGQSPPTFATQLSRPISGYYGTSYTVTVFAGVFSVSQG